MTCFSSIMIVHRDTDAVNLLSVPTSLGLHLYTNIQYIHYILTRNI